MKLSPREVDKLGLHNAGYLAQKRLARGLRLNYTESVALIASQIMEFARDGEKTVAQLMGTGKNLLGRRQVLPAVPHLLNAVQVEATFPDGTKLVTVHDPVARENGDLEQALRGSFLPVPSLDKFTENEDDGIPGEIICRDGFLTLNPGRTAVILNVVNNGDRPIQVGSHYHFIEVNPYLIFDRRKAYGMRLNVAAGTSVRFELVSIAGNKVITGGNGIAEDPINEINCEAAMEAVRTRGFGHKEEEDASEGVTGEDGPFTTVIPREEYANKFGPTTGDKIRLSDTNLFAEIEKDFALYGDECVFGGGKVIRDGMGQQCGHPPAISLDTVITNAVIIDYNGIIKADIGIKDGLIVSIGKAGNPDIMDGVLFNMIIGANTEVIAGEGLIVTAGAIDCHVHYICPQLIDEAISSGITTVVGGGTGPTDGTRATTCTPAPTQMKSMLQSTDSMPLNFGFTGKLIFACSRLREQTIAAEDILHDMGAISIISSDSQAVGRIGEVICRTWQTASKMKAQRGPLQPDESDNDNFRIKRYIAKYTINPAITMGFSQYVGSVEAGKLADLVMWKPAFFGAKPEMVIKGGAIAWADMGDPNGSIPTPEPVKMRPMFASLGKAASDISIAFVSKASLNKKVHVLYGLNKRVEAVGNVRKLTKLDMKLNDSLPEIIVDPENYTVTADGVALTCSPATTVPLSRNYFLF